MRLAGVEWRLTEAWAVGTGWRVLAIADAVLLMPLAEECFSRGVLYKPLYRKFGYLMAVVASSMLFAAFHYPKTGRILFAFCTGCLYTYLYQRTGSLIPSVTIHMSINCLALVVFPLVFGLRWSDMTISVLTMAPCLLAGGAIGLAWWLRPQVLEGIEGKAATR